MDLMYTIPAAIGLGALHSLEPGHGKGVISAYLISSGAKIKDAVVLGVISALAHTLSIALLAFSASSTMKILFPQNLAYWFQLLSGIIVIYIGLTIISQRIFPIQGERSASQHSHDHGHGQCNHDHNHGFANSSGEMSPLKGLFLTGFFTGLIPCPTALVILLAAVSADKIPFGLGLVGAFSIGSAVTMVGLGILVVRASNSIKRLEKWHVVNRLALVSSFLILFLGGALILQAISQLGIS
ncbi:ABC transporter permease [Desulfosporosinus fructosivorans]|uniref:ABC transporter permease n=1 Tax=Desulfosporosinus fructosivorans TaxID=2018669 RepID=A0A4Z0R4W0_9FIRM|nr:sulfite exporter TauE/SafE family protein [Desulfosporosinus fructosivorans]TGE38082.1 ABC transporter permease [Desulfosporosinus fructosivorans]